MSRRIELEIRRLLIEHKELERVADEIMRQWSSFPYLEEEADAAAQFLINCGLFTSLIDKVNAQIQKKHKVIWPFYAEAVGLCAIEIDQKVADAIFEGAKEQNLKKYLGRSAALNRIDPRFKKFNSKFKKEQIDKRAEKVEEILSKIEFLKSQRLFEEEKKAIAALERFSPSHPKIYELKSEFEERWARHLVSAQPSTSDRLTQSDDKLSEEWRKLTAESFHPVFESFKENGKKYPEMIIDFAIACFFFEFYSEAIELLEKVESTQQVEWLRLELYLQNRQFINALETCDRLEKNYPGDPEVNFATNLGKAKAYWGLGKEAKAIELLTSIQNIRPNYRSVSSLLQQWRGGQNL